MDSHLHCCCMLLHRFTHLPLRAAAFVAIVPLLFSCSRSTSAASAPAPVQYDTAQAVPATASVDPVIAAAGDIACAPDETRRSGQDRSVCQQQSTADLLHSAHPAAVLPLGDDQYEDGGLDGFQQAYSPSWGRFKDITRPAVGNHEYVTPNAAGYFRYFGSAAGEPDKGYYSYDLGRWHLIALNANCGQVGGCGTSSPQVQWLKADLAAHPAQCTLAYWHQPRFSSGPHGNDRAYAALWQTLYAAGVDVVLNGHDHDYERFAPQNPQGQRDLSRGMREFVVGTGGKSHYAFETVQANSEARNADTYGVLLMTLHDDSYDWRFVPIAGETFTDSGHTACH